MSRVRVETTLGEIDIDVFEDRAPASAGYFLADVGARRYDGSSFFRIVTLANSGLPYPIRCSGDVCAQIELPGVPLGSFPGSTYDEVTYALHAGDLFVFCSDGVSEAMNDEGQEFTAERLLDVVSRSRDLPPARLVERIFGAVSEWRGETPPNDDMTAVAVRITT